MSETVKDVRSPAVVSPGSALMLVRKQRGMSLIVFAKSLGISADHLRRIEKDQAAIDDLLRGKIQKVFGVDIPVSSAR